MGHAAWCGPLAYVAVGGGNVQLQLLGPDASTWLNVGTAITANGFSNLTLPSGTYRIAVTAATGVYASLTSVID
jgi:hypothetical protein